MCHRIRRRSGRPSLLQLRRMQILWQLRGDYVNYGQIVTSSSATDQQSALTNLDQLPYHNGSGRTTTIPTLLPAGTLSCSTATVSEECPNNGANFGSVTSTIGGSRVVTMDLHIVF